MQDITTCLFPRGLILPAALAAILCCAGCLEMSQALSIEKDGSGSLDLDYSLPDSTAARMKAMRELRKDMAETAGGKYEPSPLDTRFALFMDPADKPIRELMATFEPDGIVLEELKIEAAEGHRHVRMRLHFADLAKAAASDLFSTHWPITLVKLNDGTYRLNITNGRRDRAPNLDYSDPATLKSITPILKGFKALIRINAPGEIVNTSAPQVSGRSAAWLFDFGENPGAFSRFQTATMTVVFKGEGLTLPEIKSAVPAP